MISPISSKMLYQSTTVLLPDYSQKTVIKKPDEGPFPPSYGRITTAYTSYKL